MTSNPTARLFVASSLVLAAAAAAGISGCSAGVAGAAAGGLAADGGATVVGTHEDGGTLGSPTSPNSDAAPSSPSDAATAALPLATFLTLDTSQYLAAGDGGALVASSGSAGAGESFAITDVNGGALTAGDAVQIATLGGSYLSAADGGGGALTFAATAAGDDETFVLELIDGGAGPVAAGDQVALKTKVTGNYVSAINGGGGQVLANAPWDRAWETFTLGLAGGSVPASDAGLPATDGGSAASSARQKVLAYLASISGNHTAVGVEDKDSTNPHADSDQMASIANDGKTASFWSADWGFGAGTVAARETIVKEGERQWGEGAIVQFIYHACPLTMNEDCQWTDIDGSYGSLSDAQWADLTTAGGTLNKVWLARLDAIAIYFQELKDAGVAPLFRPLHEINGAWAWWQGRPGATGSQKLYQITHDYLTTTKGLDNIIWVWNVQDYTTLADDVGKYNPGASFFDIAALDVYDTGYTDGNYNAMLGAAAGKPIGIAECQTLPTPALLTQQPNWAYVAMWPDFFSDDTTQIPALFNDAQVVTLSAMPGWK